MEETRNLYFAVSDAWQRLSRRWVWDTGAVARVVVVTITAAAFRVVVAMAEVVAAVVAVGVAVAVAVVVVFARLQVNEIGNRLVRLVAGQQSR